MIILTIRTDKPQSEIGIYEDMKQLGYETWEAHRQLAETIHQKIEALLATSDKQYKDVGGIVAYKGPGSFTGLRIGMSVANALAYANRIPIVATTDDWIERGIAQILDGTNDTVALPDYGSATITTQPKK